MSIFHRALDRLADALWAGRKVRLHITADYDTARYLLPLIKKLIADDEDGETYRTALIDWHRAERPPLVRPTETWIRSGKGPTIGRSCRTAADQ